MILGKALFWDQQVGSDGVACASCHFHAGADARITNGLSPGLLQVPVQDTTFGDPVTGTTASGAVPGPDYTFVEADFPFHQLADPDDRNSDILVTTNDVFSSPGAYSALFPSGARARPRLGSAMRDHCRVVLDGIFEVDGLATRQVAPRHTPTVINAVFNDRNNWDGAANNVFNGVDPFGRRAAADPTAGVIVRQERGFGLELLDIENASLASQAVGPPINMMEMSCDGRGFADVGRRMLRQVRRPLAFQRVDPDDSVFGHAGPKGDLRHEGGGLSISYAELVQKAFHSRYWDDPGFNLRKLRDGRVARGSRGDHRLDEHNFSLFFGVAVAMYEATLVSDQSRFDDAFDCLRRPVCDPVAEGLLTQKELDGFTLFDSGFSGSGGRCFSCHDAPLFSAAQRPLTESKPFHRLNRANEEDSEGRRVQVLRDEGFFNLGLQPVEQDLGVGSVGAYGYPLSYTRQYKEWLVAEKHPSAVPVDDFPFEPCDLQRAQNIPFDQTDCSVEPLGEAAALERVKVDGAFKTPSLRNVALTPPYFHTGGMASLEQVVEYYARGGHRRDLRFEDPPRAGDDSGTGPLGEGAVPFDGSDHWTNVNVNITPLDLSLGDGKDHQYGVEAIVAFLKTLTDRRVQCDQAPFDHPSLQIFVGHTGEDADGDGRADDRVFTLPAVGAAGYDPESGLCIPNAGDLFAPGMQSRVGGPGSDPSEFMD